MRVQPRIDPSSNSTLILEYSTGTRQVRVVGKTDSLLEQSYLPIGDDLVDGPHAVFVLRSGEILVKGALYHWNGEDVVFIAVPYSDQWDIRNMFVDGVWNQLNSNAIPPFFFSGDVLRKEATVAAEFAIGDSGRPGRIAPQSEECILLSGSPCGVGPDGEYLYPRQCYSCWGSFCRAPRNRCT
jgi:hypothetical protein